MNAREELVHRLVSAMREQTAFPAVGDRKQVDSLDHQRERVGLVLWLQQRI